MGWRSRLLFCGSLLVTATMSSVWGYSKRVDRGVYWPPWGPGYVAVHMSNGAVSACTMGEPRELWWAVHQPAGWARFEPAEDVIYMMSEPPAHGDGWDLAGIRYRGESFGGVPTHILFIPLGWIIAPAALVTAATGSVAVAHRRRRRAGHCPRCGYDLRASPGRCPECAWLIATCGAKGATK